MDKTYPYHPPTVWADHTRWAPSPHVQWGSQLCLYLAPEVEWNPAEGIRGFFDRLLTWLERAAAGTLDPDGQPLHPPAVYPAAAAGTMIVRADLGDRVPWAPISGTATGPAVDSPSPRPGELMASCTRAGKRIEIVEWLSVLDAVDRALDEQVVTRDEHDRPFFVMPAVLITDGIGFEYPTRADDLARGLSDLGISRDRLLQLLVTASRINRVLRSTELDDETAEQASVDSLNADPIGLLVGTPSRRLTGTQRLAHLAAWEFDKLGAKITDLLRSVAGLSDPGELTEDIHRLAMEWLHNADVRWMRLHEMRPEVTHRRDTGTGVSWLRGQRVLLLGCGALGAPIAEHCVRAGVSAITLLDSGSVTPGILVRQPYQDADIDKPKARVLADRLNTLTPELVAQPVVGDSIPVLLDNRLDPARFDLLIDATADAATRSALERVRTPDRDSWPPIVTVLIGHQASRGVVTVSNRGASGSGHDILRRVALRSRADAAEAWSDIAADIFPDPPRAAMFFPEPGCSAPTFVGSAAEVSSLAGHMLTLAVETLAGASPAGPGSGAPMTAIAVRLTGPGTGVLTWDNDITVADESTGYEVRVSSQALAEMRTEIRRGARIRGPRVETGGMLLGAIDDGTATITIDVATGPSADSRLAEHYFDHGTAGTQEVIDHHLARSGNRTAFLGIWHTHPHGPAQPSRRDEVGMAGLTAIASVGRRALMMILGGPPTTWQAWSDHGTLPRLYARLVDREHLTPAATSPEPVPPQIGSYFPGGYRYPAVRESDGDHHTSHLSAPRRRWWRQRRKRKT